MRTGDRLFPLCLCAGTRRAAEPATRQWQRKVSLRGICWRWRSVFCRHPSLCFALAVQWTHTCLGPHASEGSSEQFYCIVPPACAYSLVAALNRNEKPDVCFVSLAEYAGDYESDEHLPGCADGGLRAGPYLPPRTKRRIPSAPANGTIKGGAQLPVSLSCSICPPALP